MRVEYLVVVPPSEPTLFEYLSRQFRDDPKVAVLVDQRFRERQQHASHAPLSQWLLVVKQSGGRAAPLRRFTQETRDGKEAGPMGEMEVLEDRQRVDRWLEEGRYLLGRTIPALLDDRDRLRGKLEAAEQDAERLRIELSELRKEHARLVGELEHVRADQTAITTAFGNAMDLLGQLHGPLSEIHKRLQPANFEAAESAA